MPKKSKALIKREKKETESVARFKRTKTDQPKKHVNRLEFFNKHAVAIGASYAETKSQLKTAKALNLPPMLVGYVVARLVPDVIKDKAIVKWVETDCSAEIPVTPEAGA